MSNVFAVRIHDVSIDLDHCIRSFCQSIDGSYMFVRETDANRVHFQGFYRTDMKPATFRSRLRKAFPSNRGNKGYSCTCVKDFNAYVKYILKGMPGQLPEIVCHCGISITDEYVREMHEEYWKTHNKGRKTNLSLLDEIEEWVNVQKWDDVDVKRFDVAEKVCDVITQRKRGLNVFNARAYYNTVMYRQSERYRTSIIHEIISKY